MARSDDSGGLQVLIMREVVIKKILLFFAVFFLFSALSAEEIPSENKENSEISENTDSCACNEYKKDNEIKKIYYSLYWVFEPPWTTHIGLDVDFLLKHTERENNIYMGLTFNPGYSFGQYSLYNVFQLPFQLNMAFDFKQQNCVVDYLSLRLSGGVNLLFGRPESSNYDDTTYNGLSKVVAAAEISLDLIFVNSMVFRVGLNMVNHGLLIESYLPLPIVGLGYRF